MTVCYAWRGLMANNLIFEDEYTYAQFQRFDCDSRDVKLALVVYGYEHRIKKRGNNMPWILIGCLIGALVLSILIALVLAYVSWKNAKIYKQSTTVSKEDNLGIEGTHVVKRHSQVSFIVCACFRIYVCACW